MLLVTGATGETGRYTVRHLLEKGGGFSKGCI